MMRKCAWALLLSLGLGHSPAIAAETGPNGYPAQVVRIINPFAAGGSLDTTGRLIAQQLQEKWGKAVIVENRPGASTTIGIAAVAHSPPNGYTLGLATNSFAMSAVRMKNLPYDSKKDLAAVSILVETPFMLVARADFPAKTVAEFVDYAKRSPGKINYGSIGSGSSPHIAAEMFKRAASIDMAHVAYKGASPALQDLLGGTISVMFANVPDVAPYLESKSLIALATTATSRSKNFPDVPTMAEVGYPQIDIKSWYAMIAPKDTPPEIIAFVSQSVAEAIKEPQVNEKLNKLELTPVASSPAELRVLIDSEIARFGKVAHDIGLEQLD